MRLNKFIATATDLSRRAADEAIAVGRVKVNGKLATTGIQIGDSDEVWLDDRPVTPKTTSLTVMLNKPVGYVCSRDGQGNKTVYDLLPAALRGMKLVGRLDKNSSGLLLLTDDGQLAYELTHPKFQKTKVYKIALNKPLSKASARTVAQGVILEDGSSKLKLEQMNENDDTNWKVTMHEGRNRQIRRTFETLDYQVVKLHRTHFGPYTLKDLPIGAHKTVG